MSQERDAFAQEFIQRLWANDPNYLEFLSPRLIQIESVTDSLLVFRSRLPVGETRHIELVDAGGVKEGDWRHQMITYQLHAGGRWARFDVVVIEQYDRRYIDLLEAHSLPASLREINALALRGKSPGHVLFLLMAIVAAGFSIAVAIYIGRSPMPGRWWWTCVALFGAGRVSMNWTTGDLVTRPFDVLFLSAGLMRAGHTEPWIISMAFPVGALIALERSRRRLKPSA